MLYVEIKDSTNKVISKSKNLRGLLDYRKKDFADRIQITVGNRRREVKFKVTFYSGNTCESYFSSFDVCKDWFKRHFKEYYNMSILDDSDDLFCLVS